MERTVESLARDAIEVSEALDNYLNVRKSNAENIRLAREQYELEMIDIEEELNGLLESDR
jgi:hypothetical protein